MKRLIVTGPQHIEDELSQSIKGQPEAVKELAKLAVKIKLGISDGHKPIDTIFLAGPSGVGKTESVLALAKYFNKDVDPLSLVIKVDGGSFISGHEVARLIGSEPGYSGFDSAKGMFHNTEMAKKKIPYTTSSGQPKQVLFILVDEVDKAHEKLNNFLLAVLDKGQTSLGDGTVSKFNDAVIFFTANTGNKEASYQTSGFVPQSTNYERSFRKDFTKHFPPEYRGRIDKVIVYNHLSTSSLSEIVSLRLSVLEKRLSSAGYSISLSMTDQAILKLISSKEIHEEGARAVVKFIDGALQDHLLLASLNGLPSKIYVDIEDGKPVLYSSKSAGLNL